MRRNEEKPHQPFNQTVEETVIEGRGRFFRRKDGKYLIYLSPDLTKDSMLPLLKEDSDSTVVTVKFDVGDNKLIIEKWKKREKQ